MGICNAICHGLHVAQSRSWVLRRSSDALLLPYSNIDPCMCLPLCVGIWVFICVLCGWLFVVLLKSLSSPMYIQSRGRWKGRSY